MKFQLMPDDEKLSDKLKLAGYEIASTGQLLVRVTCESKK